MPLHPHPLQPTAPNRKCSGFQLTLLVVLCLLSTLAASSAAWATDWADCANELDYLRRRSSDAADKAQEAASKQSDFESKRDELQRCWQFPQAYDLMRDRCQSLRSYYESALDDYKSALSDLGSALDDVNQKVRSVESSCSAELARVSGPPPKVPPGVKQPASCAVFLRYKGRLPMEQIIPVCVQQLGEEQCRLCLQ